ncbi:MAG: isoquinoline 1-oxidoreductase subunit beta, partial [Acidobacteriota bacterium]|nr:isoquinoline 1-oxidoreductase subunit beta [Acidobacteriota bacterium]
MSAMRNPFENPSLPCDSATDLDRRRFLQLAAAGGLVIAIGPGGIRRLDASDAAESSVASPWEAVAYVTLHPDGTVAIVCHRSEMGQGIRTTMPMIIADEMEADWAKCRVVQADGDDKKYGSQNTDGSTSIRDFLPRYREAGATVRALLEDAAAKEWGVAASEVQAQQHTVVHAATGRTLAFAALVPAARTLAMPAKERLRVKSPAERRWQGKKMPSIDLVPLTTGTARFGADVVLPGMKTAVIARPPVWGATLSTTPPIDDGAARKVAGVERVVRLPEFPIPGGYMPLGGVAVVASHTWAAIQGCKALAITWKPGPNAAYDSKSYKAKLEASVRAAGKPGRTQGDVESALGSAAKRISAEYYMPHL